MVHKTFLILKIGLEMTEILNFKFYNLNQIVFNFNVRTITWNTFCYPIWNTFLKYLVSTCILNFINVK